MIILYNRNFHAKLFHFGMCCGSSCSSFTAPKHPKLESILMSVYPALLQTALIYIPVIGSFASSMDSYTFQFMIARLPNIIDIPISFNPVLLLSIFATTPNINGI